MTESGLFVFDTTTLVSALLFANSMPAQAVQKAQMLGFLVCSDATYIELSEVIMRSKFDRYLDIELIANAGSSAIIDQTHRQSVLPIA